MYVAWCLTSIRIRCSHDLLQIAPPCHRCLRRVVGYLGVLDPDGLRVDKGVRTEVGKLAPVAAVLDAAYGNARVGCSYAIDENATGIQITCNLAGQLNIFGPKIAAQPELACVRRIDGRIQVRSTG